MRVPQGFHSRFVQCGQVRLHVVANSESPAADARRPLIFLHGFPEFCVAWEEVFVRLADTYCLIVPDQRGYNLSDAPAGTENYEVPRLVGDLVGLADRLVGGRRFLLCGHDWGASVAYAAAFRHPERIAGLVIANGVHPILFQRALLNDPQQCAASQYIHYLRATDAAAKLSEDGFRRLFGMFEKFSPAKWLEPELRRKYATAWGQPDRLEAMLNWYRASPIVVPQHGKPTPDAPLAQAPLQRFQVAMPHLLLWGDADIALRPCSTAGLETFAPKLQRFALKGADHWLLHTHGERIAQEIASFANSLSW